MAPIGGLLAACGGMAADWLSAAGCAAAGANSIEHSKILSAHAPGSIANIYHSGSNMVVHCTTQLLTTYYMLPCLTTVPLPNHTRRCPLRRCSHHHSSNRPPSVTHCDSIAPHSVPLSPMVVRDQRTIFARRSRRSHCLISRRSGTCWCRLTPTTGSHQHAGKQLRRRLVLRLTDLQMLARCRGWGCRNSTLFCGGFISQQDMVNVTAR